MRFLYYCFYRLSNAYKRLDKDFDLYSSGVVSMAIAGNIIVLLSIVCYEFERVLSTFSIGAIVASVMIINFGNYIPLYTK